MKRSIFTFEPRYKSTIWGGDRIARYKGETVDARNVGESWEISAVPGSETVVADGDDRGADLPAICRKYGGELLGHRYVAGHGYDFPLLVKIIDACKDLSVQVHPDDTLADRRHHCPGKTEMWFVVDTDNDARIACGLKAQLSADTLQDVVGRGALGDCLASHRSAPGDCFFIPAGRVHSIGAGNLLVEIQQSSDVTYRIDDFNRRDADGNLRELHLDLAKDAIDYTVMDDYRTHYTASADRPVPLVRCSHFNTDILSMTLGATVMLPTVDSFRIVVCIDGEITIGTAAGETVRLKKGHSALVAADADVEICSPDNKSTSLLSYL